MVHRIGKNHAVWQLRGQRTDACLICDIAAGENERALLVVQGGKLTLQRDHGVAGA